jgi:cell division protein FtsB
MARRRESLRESIRTAVHDYSLVAVAAMVAMLGYAVSEHVIPNYHELKALEQRRDQLKHDLAAQKEANERLRGEIAALEDPYYLTELLITKYKWRPAPLQVEQPSTR